MAYSTMEQVADEFQGISFSATTNPTADTVERWISEADALIDAKVGLRYVTPLEGANSLLILRQISIFLVAARVRRRLNRVGADAETQKSRPADSEKTAMKMLDDIVASKTDLPDGTLKSAGGGVSSYAVAHGESCPHTFKKDCEQW